MFRFMGVAKKGHETFRRVNCLTQFSSLHQHSLCLSLLHTHTHTQTLTCTYSQTHTHTQACRRCCVTIFSHAGVSLPHYNCEFNWCCHMVCNGVSSDCRGRVKETQIFFLRRKGASAELGLRKKHHFLISFSSILTLLLKCKLPNTSCGEETWHIYSSFFLC